MVWDKNNPPGNTKISVGDNTIRANNDQIETAINLEHSMSTGGNQEGRHTFERDTIANRDGPAVAFQNGSIFFATDERTGRLVIQVRDGDAWENVDIEPMDTATSLIPTLPRLDSKSDFITCQFATYAQVTPTVDGAGPDQLIAIDLALSPFKYATLAADTTISNPLNSEAGKGTTVALDLVQSGSGGHIVTFGTDYRSPGGSLPAVDTTASARTMVYLTVLQSGSVLVTSVPGITTIP